MAQEVTLGEIARKLDTHIEDTKNNNKSQNEMLQLLVIQSTATKGDIANLQKEVTNHGIVIDKHGKNIESLNGYKKYLVGGAAVFSIVGVYLYKAATQDIKNDLQKDITTALKTDLTQSFEKLLDDRV